MTACLGCQKPYEMNRMQSHGWWHFNGYWGKHGQGFHGKTLKGSACPDCSTRIYDEPGFYEQCVATQEAAAQLGPEP